MKNYLFIFIGILAGFDLQAQPSHILTEFPESAILAANHQQKFFPNSTNKVTKSQAFFRDQQLSALITLQAASQSFAAYALWPFDNKGTFPMYFDTLNPSNLLFARVSKDLPEQQAVTANYITPGLYTLYDTSYYYYENVEKLKAHFPEVQTGNYLVDTQGRVIMLNRWNNHYEWYFDKAGRPVLILIYKNESSYVRGTVADYSISLVTINISYKGGMPLHIMFSYLNSVNDEFKATEYSLNNNDQLRRYTHVFNSLSSAKTTAKINASDLYRHPGNYAVFSRFTFNKGKIARVEKAFRAMHLLTTHSLETYSYNENLLTGITSRKLSGEVFAQATYYYNTRK